ncbi:MAG: hypothetical protein AAB392_02625 [Patescibacteria group bacterium]
MRALLQNIREKPEHHKRSVAFGLSLVLTFVVALGWLGQKSLFDGSPSVAKNAKTEAKKQTASAIDSAPSPLESSKKSVSSGLNEVKEAYENLKESLADVLVPFITGIEVYERK